jgi:hypothetical protein
MSQPPPSELEIRVNGRLEPRWSGWFDGLTITADEDGTTVLRGPVADQAALHGVLQKIRDLGLTLLSVVPMTPGRAEPTVDTDTQTPGELI